MRSEKEIRDKINELKNKEKYEAKEIKRMSENNEWDFIDLHMNRGNMYKSHIYHLMWVLGEID